MKTKQLLLSAIFLSIILSISVFAQEQIRIGILKDADSPEADKLTEILQEEINSLLQPRAEIAYKIESAALQNQGARQIIKYFMEDDRIDIIISIGLSASNELVKFDYYKKPSIAANILDLELQQLPQTKSNTSGIKNFTYIEPVINLKEDLKVFTQIFNINRLAIIGAEPIKEYFPEINTFITDNKTGVDVTVISALTDVQGIIDKLPAQIDAAIVLPLLQFETSEIAGLFNKLNKRRIITLAPIGIEYVELGASITMTPRFTFKQLARHTALRVLKCFEGNNPADISFLVEQNKRQPVINFASLRAANKYPPAEFLNESLLINVAEFPGGDKVTLRGAIAEALENNLTGKISKEDFALAETDVKIVKSNIFPQLEVSGTGIELSENLVESSMGQKGELTITGSVSLKQVIFSEPAFANITINKLASENKKYVSDETVLDIIADISNAYLSALFAKTNLNIQNENVNTTIQNLQIAKAKEESGQTDISDVNRWESELSLNKIKMNDAYASFKASLFNLNNYLNKEIGKTIQLPDSGIVEKSIIIPQNLFTKLFEDPELTDSYADFILNEMKNNSPELKQLSTAGKIFSRQKSMHKRQLFLPELYLFGSVDQTFVRNGTITNPHLPIPPPPDDATWNVGVSLKFPLFQGGKTITQIEKSELELKKLSYQEDNLLNNFESRIRAGVEKLRASFLEVHLSNKAALAAKNNYKIVQDAYSQGVANLVQLVDAQNVMTQTKHMAAISFYQYLLDYIQLERLQGKYIFLSGNDEQEVYLNRLNNFLFNGE